VGTIYLNGVDINMEQVKKGMAWVYTHYCKDPAYYKAWDIAKKNKIGTMESEQSSRAIKV